MCGIVGFCAGRNTCINTEDVIDRMTAPIAHRGPDDFGTWIDSSHGVALGHRRLSILDLSPLGRQPMVSACGRYVISYNGEIYNHLEIRSDLENLGHSFLGSSDTETLLAAISQWGVEGAVTRTVGMFAIAVWDVREKQFFLVRDRVGIKPLYFGIIDSSFVFGSELKALLPFPGFTPEIDRNALTLLFRHNYIPTPHCIYKGLYKQRPGTIVVYKPSSGDISERVYWEVRSIYAKGCAAPMKISEEEALDELELLLTDSIEKRRLSDVPVGAFLSGGVDSSVVAALMQASSPDAQIKTFCLGFKEEGYDEAPFARAVADHLGTDHVERRLSFNDLIKDVPHFPTYWDEPFSDNGQLTAHMVSKIAREHVTVCLSGDGGDELFLGYPRYFHSSWRGVKMLPSPLRKTLRWVAKETNRHCVFSNPRYLKIVERLSLLGSKDFSDYYRYIVSHSKFPADLVLGGKEPEVRGFDIPEQFAGSSLELMGMWDLEGYIHDGILTKVDRASMSEALEVRVPILDHRVVEFSARLPLELKIGDGKGKYLLRKLLYKYVPQKLVDRPKMGFAVPLNCWLKNELRDWAEDLLDENLLKKQGLLDHKRVRALWDAFLKGLPGGEYRVWDLLMFQAWLGAGRWH